MMKVKALVLNKVGGPEVLNLSEVQLSDLRADEIQVKVHFSGLNFAEILMRQGLYQDAPPLPFTPGYEWSGEVIALGENVKGFEIGEHVFGGSRFGSHQEIININSKYVLKAVGNLSMQEMAGAPVSMMTSYASVIEMGGLRSHHHLLVDCGSGGLGQIALQMAKAVGAKATGLTSSPQKKDIILSQGAEAYTHEEWKNLATKYDVILNSQLGSTVRTHVKRLKPMGRVVCVGVSEGITPGKRDLVKMIKLLMQTKKFKMTDLFNNNSGIMAVNLLTTIADDAAMKLILKNVSEFLEKGVKPIIGHVYSKNEFSRAHDDLENRRCQGKVIIDWS